MSVRQHRHRVRWRFVLPCALGVVLIALALVALQTRYSLLTQSAKRETQLQVLSAAWWIEQSLFWSVLAWTALELVAAARARRNTRCADAQAQQLQLPEAERRFRRHYARRGWLVSALLTLALLQIVGAADLWLAERPVALPEDLSLPAPNKFRVAAIGGSAAAGFPYERRHAFPALVGWQLQLLFPEREVLVDNLAERGYTLQDACRNLNKLKALPNVLLVYSGHNEFLMRYRLDRTPDERSRFQPSFLARALARRIQAIRQPPEIVDNLQLRDVERPLFDRPVASAAEWAHRERTFRRQLEAVVRWCRRNDVLPILIIPAANESGFEPCRSYLPLRFSADKERRLRAVYATIDQRAATAKERPGKPLAGEAASDIALLTEARELSPNFAMTWFLLGRAYEAAGDYEPARRAYGQALAHDGFPWHATPFARIYREVAAEYDVPLLDAREILRPLAPHGILDDHLFHDVLHPSLTAHLAIARTVLAEARRHNLPVHADHWPEAPDARSDRLSRSLKLSPDLWARVCDQVAKAQLGVPPGRFDVQRRRHKARLYRQAAAQLRAGADPKSISLPGIGNPAPGGTNDDG